MASSKRSGSEPSVRIHVTRSFSADVQSLYEEIGAEADAVLTALFAAVKQLEDQRAMSSLPLAPYGKYGDSFLVDFSPQFSFTFKRSTDRKGEGQPLVRHFYLKNLLRRKGSRN